MLSANLNELVKVLTLEEFGYALLEICRTGLQEVVVVEGESFTFRVVKPAGAPVVTNYCYQSHAELKEGDSLEPSGIGQG